MADIVGMLLSLQVSIVKMIGVVDWDDIRIKTEVDFRLVGAKSLAQNVHNIPLFHSLPW
jgi:hypothetical protein